VDDAVIPRAIRRSEAGARAEVKRCRFGGRALNG
jgi:hypothetical protein